MEELLKTLNTVIDIRQSRKVRHKIGDIIALVFFATLSGADDWVSMEIFGKEHESFMRRYIELPNGVPSHDTIQRVMAMIPSECLEGFQRQWNELMNQEEGSKIKKILAIDGKTQCGNKTASQKANHIVSIVDENGFCLGEECVDEKSNEIPAIPELLDKINIEGQIITTDAMGTQKEIVKKIRKKRADYVLALKGNQGSLYEDVKQYFSDEELLSQCSYVKTTEKARGGIEKREYWQTDDIDWLSQRKDWAGLKTVGMTRNTITKDGKKQEETRYFISSLPVKVEEMARAIRSHWMVESFHWHLDVTFHEDANKTVEKQAALNQNIIRKMAINVLRIFEAGKKKLSMRLKRFSIGTNPEKHLKTILDM
jgi:predicted transposase YbfD/YdcC